MAPGKKNTKTKKCGSEECNARMPRAANFCPRCGFEQAKMGRPRVKIDWEEFDKLCGMQCTEEEIASWFGCSVDAITDNLKRDFGMTFPEYFEQKRGVGKVGLRRRQWKIAMSDERGATAMAIFLGKNWLGQSDRMESKWENSGKAEIQIIQVPDNGRGGSDR